MKTIKLTQGKVALVDDTDYDLLSKYSWCLHTKRYACSRINGKVILMHIFLLGKQKGKEIDHINRNKLDNRRENLRFVTRSINCFNVDIDKANKSGFKGVSWDKRGNKWRATIKLNYKQVYSSSFLTKEEAIMARQMAFNNIINIC